MRRRISLFLMCGGLVSGLCVSGAVAANDAVKTPQAQDKTYTFKEVPVLAGRTFDLTRPSDRHDFLNTLYTLPPKKLPGILKNVAPADLHTLYAEVCVGPYGHFRSLHDQWQDPVVQGIAGQIKLDNIAKSAVHPAVRLSLFSVKTAPKILWATVEPDFTNIVTGRPYREVVTHPVFLEWLQTRPQGDWARIEGAVGAYTLEENGKAPLELTGVAKTFDDGVAGWRKSYVKNDALPGWLA